MEFTHVTTRKLKSHTCGRTWPIGTPVRIHGNQFLFVAGRLIVDDGGDQAYCPETWLRPLKVDVVVFPKRG